MASQGESPTSVDTPLDYITVDSYEWPKEPPRPKRLRLETEEQKRRHRADQKRFMQRKRARLVILRQEAKSIELQCNYLRVLQEEKDLRAERERLNALEQVQIDACTNAPVIAWLETPFALDVSLTELDDVLVDLILSL